MVLLEQAFAGSGATGRSGGVLVGPLGWDLSPLATRFGAGRMADVARFAEATVAYTEQLIEKYRISCDYERIGTLYVNVHPSQEHRVRRLAKRAEIGVPVHFLESAELRERGIPPAFLCGAGWWSTNSNMLSPMAPLTCCSNLMTSSLVSPPWCLDHASISSDITACLRPMPGAVTSSCPGPPAPSKVILVFSK